MARKVREDILARKDILARNIRTCKWEGLFITLKGSKEERVCFFFIQDLARRDLILAITGWLSFDFDRGFELENAVLWKGFGPETRC